MSVNPFLFNTHDLPRRAGEMREYELTIEKHDALGFEVLAIAEDEPIDIDLRIESVAEGVLASASVRTVATGECGRCLDPVSYDVDEKFQELYAYVEDPRQARKKAKPGKKRVAKEEDDLDEDLVREMEGEQIDLDGPIRVKWSELPDDHQHEQADIRWAGLANWDGKLDGKLDGIGPL